MVGIGCSSIVCCIQVYRIAEAAELEYSALLMHSELVQDGKVGVWYSFTPLSTPQQYLHTFLQRSTSFLNSTYFVVSQFNFSSFHIRY